MSIWENVENGWYPQILFFFFFVHFSITHFGDDLAIFSYLFIYCLIIV